MIRTQVSLTLTEDQVRDIRLRAKRAQMPEDEVIGDLVRQGLKTGNPDRRESTGDSLLRLAAIGGKAPADLSMRVDDYLYGEDN